MEPTHKIEFPLGDKAEIRAAEINYATDLALGDVITIFPELTEESKNTFTEQEQQELKTTYYTPSSVGAGGVVRLILVK